MLRAWEGDAAPGFLISLMRIAEQHGAIDESLRLLAVVLAKNAVGSSWRKTLGTREWSRVPDEEKGTVRALVLQALLSDPSDRVGTQLGLLAANICRFDFPSNWPDVLEQLLAAVAWTSPYQPHFKLRALKSLKHIFRALTTKRFVVDAPRQPRPGSPGLMAMADIGQRLAQERLQYKDRLRLCSTPLQQLTLQHLPVFLSAGPNWQMHGLFAKASVSATSELLYLLPSADDLLPGSRELLEALHTACVAIMAGAPTPPPPAAPGAPPPPPPPALDPAALAAWLELGGRLHERLTRCVLAHLDSFALPFAQFVPFFLQLFVDTALVRLDAATLRAMRAKRRVLLVRFIAKALLCPYYRPEWLEANDRGDNAPDSPASRARVAHDALQALLSPPQVGPLVEALVSKYVALTPDELEEWQSDPESYIRSADVESGPDADTPRPVGVGMLLCMLERGGESVAQALLGLAARLQAGGNTCGTDAALLREAVYRCIGEGYSHVSAYVNFGTWYGSEISGQLRSQLPMFMAGSAGIIASALQARALWLLGTCGSALPQPQWIDAYGLAVQYMACADLVVALQAVQGVLLMTVQLLDDQQIIAQMEQAQLAAQKSSLPGGAAVALDAALEAQAAGVDEEVAAEAAERLAWRLEALVAVMPDLLRNCFTLLQRLSEVESSVRLLQLISVVAEAAGERLQPQLGPLAAALPAVWQAASQQHATAARDTGALARLHSALIAVLTHLVGKLRGAALSDPQLQGVLYPLLTFATNLSSPESEVLVEEAFKLWLVALSAAPSVAPQMLELLPNMAAILRRGKDNTAAFQVLEGYLLLGAGSALQPYSEVIAGALLRAISGVCAAVVGACGDAGGGADAAMHAGGGPPRAATAAPVLATETTQEGLAGAALADVMLQLYPSDVPSLLLGSFRTMAALVASAQLPMQGVAVKALNVLESFLEVLARLFLGAPAALPALLDNDSAALGRCLDRWLLVASAQFLEELLGVRHMAMLGRFRRRIGAVALCAVMQGGAVPLSLLDGGRVARLAALMTRVLNEDTEFGTDLSHLDSMDFKAELGEDYVLARRLEVSRGDAVRSVNIRATFHAAMQQCAAAAGGDAALVARCTQATPQLARHVHNLLSGNLLRAPAAGAAGGDTSM